MKAIEITTLDAFHKHVEYASHQKPVVALVWGDPCAPCASLKPKLLQLSEKHGFPLAMVNGMKHKHVALGLRVRSVPTVVVWINGKELLRFSGDKTIEDLETTLARVGTFQ